MLDFVKSIFKNNSEPNPHLEVRRDSFFIEDKYHQQYLKNGWCVVKGVVLKDEINRFMNTFNEISNLEGFELNENLLNSGRLFNPEIRKRTQEVINANAATILPRMFKMEMVDAHTGGAYQVKPPHKNSDLLIHQDSTVIDETKDYCLFVWIPFCDITMENGYLSFVPGSHLWGNTQRSLGVPWQFKKHIDTLYQYVTPVLANAGDVIVFDPACIHASTPNWSKHVRHAITITVLKKNYQLIYYFRNPEISSHLIEKYEVSEDFYYEYDFKSKPDETKWNKEIVPFEAFNLTRQELLKLIKGYGQH